MEKPAIKNLAMLFGILLVLVLFSVFVIKPSITGYAVYNQIKKSDYTLEDYGKNIEELESQLLITNANLSSCKAYNEEILEDYSNKVSECNTELNYTTETYEEKLKDLRFEISDMNKENVNLKYKYNLFAENVANNLCCKARVDNSDIDSYEIDDNMIKCLEDGEEKISC